MLLQYGRLVYGSQHFFWKVEFNFVETTYIYTLDKLLHKLGDWVQECAYQEQNEQFQGRQPTAGNLAKFMSGRLDTSKTSQQIGKPITERTDFK